eukprot:1153185-Pelagomonas_calceolata.AAC.5
MFDTDIGNWPTLTVEHMPSLAAPRNLHCSELPSRDTVVWNKTLRFAPEDMHDLDLRVTVDVEARLSCPRRKNASGSAASSTLDSELTSQERSAILKSKQASRQLLPEAAPSITLGTVPWCNASQSLCDTAVWASDGPTGFHSVCTPSKNTMERHRVKSIDAPLTSVPSVALHEDIFLRVPAAEEGIWGA